MCTVTWFIDQQNLQLSFNRDEQKTRAHAVPPGLVNIDGVNVVYPVDPDGGGTWISVNDGGFIVCLLNNYRHAAPLEQKNWTSRGKLVQQLASLTSHQAIEAAINGQDMLQYRAFHLLVLNIDQQLSFNWNGHTLGHEQAPAYFSSSGFDTMNVLAGREQQYKTHQPIDNAQAALDFHSSHQPQKSAYSVCMHRDDANTTSLCHISVGAKDICFDYWNAPPCEAIGDQRKQSRVVFARNLVAV